MNNDAVPQDIRTLWQAHRQADLPDVPRDVRGELLVLDDILGGCVTFYLSSGGLDQPRQAILEDYRADLDRLMPNLEAGATAYFSRLDRLAGLLLATLPPQREPGT